MVFVEILKIKVGHWPKAKSLSEKLERRDVGARWERHLWTPRADLGPTLWPWALGRRNARDVPSTCLPRTPTLDLEVAIQVSQQDPSQNGHEGRLAMPPGIAVHILTSYLIKMTFSENGLHCRLATPTGGQNQEKWEQDTHLWSSWAGSAGASLNEQGSMVSNECLPRNRCGDEARAGSESTGCSLPTF